MHEKKSEQTLRLHLSAVHKHPALGNKEVTYVLRTTGGKKLCVCCASGPVVYRSAAVPGPDHVAAVPRHNAQVSERVTRKGTTGSLVS